MNRYNVGDKSGRLTLVRSAGREREKLRWFALCDCGQEVKIIAFHFLNGRVKSCGCLRDELNRVRPITHNMTDSPEHVSWRAMRERCGNPNATNYRWYGALGVTVCDRWSEFENFLQDMGLKPDPTDTIERVDATKNYSPDNCVWLARKLQNSNKRKDKVDYLIPPSLRRRA